MRGLGVVIALLGTSACGKKGPPLAPLVRVPAAVEQISARRVGGDVYVTLTVPSANIDQFTPADVTRIEVFGYTGRTAPPRSRWVELGTLIATIPVAPPPAPPAPAGEKPATSAPKPDTVNAPAQGEEVTIVDTLTADELVQGKLPVVEPGTRNPRPSIANQEPGTANQEPGTGNQEPGTGNQEPGTGNQEPPMLRRFYTAFPFSPRGRPGPPGAVGELPLLTLPEAPPSVAVRFTEQQVLLAWEPAGGLIAFLLERTLPDEPLPIEVEEEADVVPDPAAPSGVALPDQSVAGLASPDQSVAGPLLYNVYRTTSEDPFAPPPDTAMPPAWTREPPTPVNPVPLTTLEFADTVAFNRERCYTVRAVRGVGPDARVGHASPTACVTPVDIFPPSPPQGLGTVASAGVISLIWEPNAERDLAGYVVLRGDTPDATLQPLTLTPITESAYRDTAVTPGVRYVYAVVAVDNRFPVPNVSNASTPIEETAR
jgi:hypothetical protein